LPYVVEVMEEAGYVTVVLSGDVSRDEHESSTQEASQALTATNCKRLLVDATEANHRMSVGENYDFASALRTRHPLGIHIAVLVLKQDFDYLKFVENVARNRGVDLVVFTEQDQALEWLLGRG